jgi:glycosyltransferase involved in cell wall biosynthesis
MLEFLLLTFAGIHFALPLVYFLYVRARWLNKPWNVGVDESYRPKVTIIVPTYNEAELIQKRLDNIYHQDYPKELMEVIVVDSGSNDGTSKLVEEWARQHPKYDIKIIREEVRRGKLHALNTVFKKVHLTGEVVMFTDADCFWEANALKNIVGYFADAEVGSVTGSIFYEGEIGMCENSYRNFYNKLRIAESKRHSTPVHNGPLLAIRTVLLRKFGLPNFPGSDDSAFGSFIAFSGHRAIQIDNAIVKEPMRGSKFRRKIRRAQHLLLSFLKTKGYVKKMGLYVKSPFEKIWRIEWYLHVINPWFLVVAGVFLVFGVLCGSFMALFLLGLGLAFLAFKPYRIWLLQQIYLILAAIRNLWTKDIMWNK